MMTTSALLPLHTNQALCNSVAPARRALPRSSSGANADPDIALERAIATWGLTMVLGVPTWGRTMVLGVPPNRSTLPGVSGLFHILPLRPILSSLDLSEARWIEDAPSDREAQRIAA